MRETIQAYPCSQESEVSILGAIILDNRCFNQAASALSASDFYLSSHRTIYSRMCDIIGRGGAVDYTTLIEELTNQKQRADIGGMEYVVNLTDGIPRVKNIEHYVKIVREKARARMLIQMAESAMSQLHNFSSADEVLTEIQSRIIDILHHGRVGTNASLPDICRDALNKLNEIRKSEGACIGLSTGIQTLDEMTTGFRQHEFYVIGARPGQGKTAWMCQSVRVNALARRKVSVFSLEVPREQIIYRLACQHTGISVFDTRDPRVLSAVDMNRLAEACSEIAQWPILIEDTPRLTIKQFAAIGRLHVSQGAEAIYVDFLQKMKHPSRSEYDRVTAIADGLWEFGRSTGVPVIALSQLKRTDDVPKLEDLRSSGEIEQNANAAFFLWRPKEVDPATQMKRYTGEDQIIIEKQRSGIAGTHIPVRFNGEIGLFEERIA